MQHCPLCMNRFDETDLSFVPCMCKYRVCLWCVHRLRSDGRGCPACRRPYNGELLDAKPRQLKKKNVVEDISGAQFFQQPRRRPATSTTATDPGPEPEPSPSTRGEDPTPPAKKLAGKTAKVRAKSVPATSVPPVQAHAETDPWSAGADPWAVVAADRPRTKPPTPTGPARTSDATTIDPWSGRKEEPKKPAASATTTGVPKDWWAVYVAERAEAAASPWHIPEQGKAARDLFDASGLTTRELNCVGPSRGDTFESWLQKRRDSRSSGGGFFRTRSAVATPQAGRSGRKGLGGEEPSLASVQPLCRSHAAAPLPQEDVTTPTTGRRRASYAGALLGEVVKAEVPPHPSLGSSATAAQTVVQLEPMTLEGPPGSEGFFVTRHCGRRGPAVPEGFGPSALPPASSEPPSTAPERLEASTVEYEDAGIRVRARLALQEAMRATDAETMRRRLANAEAVGVSAVLRAAARARIAELDGAGSIGAAVADESPAGVTPTFRSSARAQAPVNSPSPPLLCGRLGRILAATTTDRWERGQEHGSWTTSHRWAAAEWSGSVVGEGWWWGARWSSGDGRGPCEAAAWTTGW